MYLKCKHVSIYFRCNVVINFKDEAHIHRLDLSEEQCGQCEATYLHVTFHKVGWTPTVRHHVTTSNCSTVFTANI